MTSLPTSTPQSLAADMLKKNRLTESTTSESSTSVTTGIQRTRLKRRKTSHLKAVPQERSDREFLQQKIREQTDQLDKRFPLAKEEMEQLARRVLEKNNFSETYLGWTMVTMATEFWREQVTATPTARRLLLLPHCLKHADGCPADYDQFGLDCKTCGACSIADFRTTAEKLGYKVLVAEGSPIVLKIIVSGYVDAILGVACLNVLEKSIDKILLAGIPCMAIPLLSDDCRNTSVDEDLVMQMIVAQSAAVPKPTETYLPLMREAQEIFSLDSLHKLMPQTRKNDSPLNTPSPNALPSVNPTDIPLDPIVATETIAYQFLAEGGKYARPFITLAAYDAMIRGQKNNAPALGSDQNSSHAPSKDSSKISDAIRRAALSIEAFHKASLVHDDIQDEDPYRYGKPTLHKTYGVATAINVGDYLIGMGYRCVSRDLVTLGAETAADILDKLAQSHLKLCEGQGAELYWRDALDKSLTPLDALKIYTLKTSPAFEAALYSGIRLAGPAKAYEKQIKQLAKYLGIAFQILNDLKDWSPDLENKRTTGKDILGGRPTLLWALALETLQETDRLELLQLVTSPNPSEEKPPVTEAEIIARVHVLYLKADVFNKARLLVEKYEQRAQELAETLTVPELKRLVKYLIKTILDRPAEQAPVLVEATELTESLRNKT